MEFLASPEKEMLAIADPEVIGRLPKCWDELPSILRKKVFDGCPERDWSLPYFSCSSCNIKTNVSLKGEKVEYYMLVMYFDMFISAETKTLWSLETFTKELSKIREYVGDYEEELTKFDGWYQKIF
ncbi:hypothetical protein A9K97_gp064 [Tokyovirus A1]|uniref:hypothetical protein n=1 Tax=Tokyovirus A1 TaxID=1826170 RepID=UPI0007A98603|nr:hypothetical protein A9K97_gp064 [Tokyovirus A1]BAU80287.1 hypothetical protein [Tokyovirus A1]